MSRKHPDGYERRLPNRRRWLIQMVETLADYCDDQYEFAWTSLTMWSSRCTSARASGIRTFSVERKDDDMPLHVRSLWAGRQDND